MTNEKLKPCPWCTRRDITLVTLREKRGRRYFFRCSHCGWTSGKSRFRWYARYLWNHLNQSFCKRRRHRIYGREG